MSFHALLAPGVSKQAQQQHCYNNNKATTASWAPSPGAFHAVVPRGQRRLPNEQRATGSPPTTPAKLPAFALVNIGSLCRRTKAIFNGFPFFCTVFLLRLRQNKERGKVSSKSNENPSNNYNVLAKCIQPSFNKLAFC